EFTPEELEKFKKLQDKVAFIKDYVYSEELIKYFRTNFYNPSSQEEILHMKKRENLINEIANVVQKEIAESGLAEKVGYPNLFNYYKTHVPVDYVNIKNELDCERLKSDDFQYKDAKFITDNGVFYVSREVEKMSKSKYNVVNPDDICNEYGADTLRLYEMFLGPLEQAKPWNTAGITGVFGFLKKLWRLYFDDNGLNVTDEEPTKEMYKSLHKTIKKVTDDIENFSFNTSVSQFMICVNELSQQKCHHRAILEPLAILISPYAPHIAEELWNKLGHNESIATAPFPVFDEKHLIESEKEYPVSFNGKMRFTINLPLDLSVAEIEKIILADSRTQEQLQGREPKKVIIVPGKIINIVG